MNRIAEALCAALRSLGDTDTSEVPGLTPEEWHQVAALAIRQRVGPLLLSSAHLPFPDAVRALLRARAEWSARRVLVQQAAFRELAAAVAPLGTRVVALKGIHLASAAYATATVREMADIDVLVPAGQLHEVADVARRLGYTESRTAGTSHHHLPTVVRGRVGLEIHWQVADGNLGCRADSVGLLDRAVPFPGVPGALGLCPEDLLLHTCMHAADHHVLELGLRSLCDVRAIVAKAGPGLHWPTVVARSRQWGTERGLGLMLTMAQRHLGVRMPDQVWAELSGVLPDPALVVTATDFLLEDAANLAGTSEAAAALLRLDSHTQRLRHIAHQLVKPAETRPGADRSEGLRSVPALITRAAGLARRHGGWLWRASREPHSPVRTALEKRQVLAAWIRGD